MLKKDRTPSRRPAEAGYSLIELMLALVVIGLVMSIAIPKFSEAFDRSHRATVAEEGRKLYQALIMYGADRGAFPATLDATSLAPLSDEGYFDNPAALVVKLQNNQLTGYSTQAGNTEFVVVMQSKGDPDAIFVALQTDNWAGDPGTWYDGIFYLVDSKLVAVSEATTG